MLKIEGMEAADAFDLSDAWFRKYGELSPKSQEALDKFELLSPSHLAVIACAAADPEDYRPWYVFGLRAFQYEEYEVALLCAKRAYGLEKGDYDVLATYVINLRYTGRHREAIELAKKWLRRKPLTAELAQNVADCYECLGRWAPAERWAIKALEIDPGDATAKETLKAAQKKLRKGNKSKKKTKTSQVSDTKKRAKK